MPEQGAGTTGVDVGMKGKAALVAAVAMLATGVADAKIKFDRAFRFPAGQPARILVFRPDVQVASLGAGGVEQPNADDTAQARTRLAAALEQQQRRTGNQVIFLADQEGDNGQLVADYRALFRTVAGAVVEHAMNPQAKLPTKKDRFDWTLGPEAARLKTLGGGDYALFLYTHDAFGSASRKAMQIFAAVALGAYMKAGVHESYAALVDLSTGNLVWFNVDPGSGGDPRTDEGAAKRVGQLLNEFPAATATATATATTTASAPRP